MHPGGTVSMTRPILRTLLFMAVLSGLALFAPRTPSHAETPPVITLSPSSGPPGTTVSVTGGFVGCSVSVRYEVIWGENQVVAQGDSFPVSGFGNGFYANFTVPAGASLGVHEVRVPVMTAPCWRTLHVGFTVTSGLTPTPTPTLSPSPTTSPTPLPPGGFPRAGWIVPDDGAVVTGPIQFAARAAPSRPRGPAIAAVRFTAAVGDAPGDVACNAPQADPDGIFTCSWDPAAAGVMGGPIQISFDVADQTGQVSRNAAGTRVVTYQPPAPTETPAPVATSTPAPQPLPPGIPIWTDDARGGRM